MAQYQEKREHHPDAHAVTQDPEFRELVKSKNAISTTLTVLMLVVYFGFASLLAFAPQTLSAPAGSATIGIPIGIGVIIFAWILTGIYVRWANTKYDSLITHLKARIASGASENVSDKNTDQEESA
jgi:uncharacterized membrane protein (DUF485 family)